MFLEKILIKNSPAFESVNITPSKGLNIISGASGSGKSVFFGSLLALFGIKESNAGVIEAEIGGEIDLREYPQEEEVLVQILKKDKARYYLNEQSSSKKRFNEIFSPYIKLLTHKNSNELSSEYLLEVLDTLISSSSHHQTLREFQEGFIQLQELQNKLKTLKEEQKNLIELKEFALFEIERIEKINPKIGEYEELLAYKKRLSKKEKLQSLANEALSALEGMGSVNAFLEGAELKLEGFESIMLEARALIESECEKLNVLGESDPEEILDRLSSLNSLISRYGGIEEALARLEEQKVKLKGYESIDEDFSHIQKEIDSLDVKLQALSKSLSLERKKALEILIQELNSYAKLLLLEEIRFSLSQAPLHFLGADELGVCIKQSGVQTLSSGEYNRLRLAVLAVENKKDGGILLLDEIDANLSGEESEGVAKVLKKLSSTYQVFAISHQPHLPSYADVHFLVKKGEEKSRMIALDREGRVKEIARMISGSTLTPEALEFANKKLQI